MNKKYQTILFVVISVSLVSIYSYRGNGSFVVEAHASDNDNTVRISCLDIALVLAVLDFSIELGDRDSVDETLKESNIAPNLISLYPNLEKVLDTARANCPGEKDILQYSNFSK